MAFQRGSSPEQLAADPEEVGVSPDDRSRRTTAITAVPAACAATDGSAFWLTDQEPGRDGLTGPDGIAALLRYPANVATAHRST